MSTSWVYAGFLLAAALFALYSHFHANKYAPFSKILQLSLAHPTTRLTLTIIWWWLGWHFFGSQHNT